MEYIIRHMKRKDLDTAVSWAAKEGWNPGLYDADAFYAVDHHGFFMGFLGNEPIASLSAVSYDSDFGFLGFYIVKPEHRGKGYGYRLWKEALKHLPTQNIGLDGVVAQQENYKKSGFRLAYRNIRYEGMGETGRKATKQIVPLVRVPWQQLLAYDRLIFPADRSKFLKLWIIQPKSLAIGYVKDKRLRGYSMVRKCRIGYKVGPLFADNEEIADTLYQVMRTLAGKGKIYLDVPEVNKEAVTLAHRYRMKPMFETARMYTKNAPNVPFHQIFGVTTFELG